MNNQQLQLVNFEQAKRLKNVGFDWYTEYVFDSSRSLWPRTSSDGTPVPSVALALKWMRDVKKRVGYVIKINNAEIVGWTFRRSPYGPTMGIYDTYESAESALLDELLKLIENNVTNY